MCTTIGFAYSKGNVFGRTLEIGTELDHSVLMVPKNTKGFIHTENGQFPSLYSAIGTGFIGVPALGDGINEHGLVGSSNLFPGMDSFSVDTVDDKINLSCPAAFNYLLTRCKSTSEVKKAAEKLNIMEKSSKGERSINMHFYFMDKKGNSLVLESKRGQLLAYDNPYGVLTNAPRFDWHTTNLKNYLTLSPKSIDEAKYNGVPLFKFGEGNGMAGLPGDFTPTSRFVRSAYFVSHTPKNLKRDAAILQGFRILSQFDIPTGSVANEENGYQSKTLYTSMMDTTNLSYYIKCHDNINIQCFNLNAYMNYSAITFIPLVKEELLV